MTLNAHRTGAHRPWSVMTKSLSSLLLIAAAIGGSASATDRPTTPRAREHRATLDAFRTAQVRAYLQGDPRGMLESFADTVRLMPGHQKAIVGKVDAGHYHRAFLKRFTVTAYDRQPIEAVDIGPRVMEIGRFTMTVRSPSANGAAEAHTLAGKYLDLWEKTAAGALVLQTAGWNYDQRPEIADRLRFDEVPSVHMALQGRAPVNLGASFQLAALNKLQESAIIQRDGKLWTMFYADDVIALTNQGRVESGRQAIDEYLIAHAQKLPVFEKLDLRTNEILDLGEYVIEFASAVVTFKVEGYAGVTLGKGIVVWRREQDGALRIWRAISMYD
jgi:ketosteroid isomerase-like protein